MLGYSAIEEPEKKNAIAEKESVKFGRVWGMTHDSDANALSDERLQLVTTSKRKRPTQGTATGPNAQVVQIDSPSLRMQVDLLSIKDSIKVSNEPRLGNFFW